MSSIEIGKNLRKKKTKSKVKKGEDGLTLGANAIGSTFDPVRRSRISEIADRNNLQIEQTLRDSDAMMNSYGKQNTLQVSGPANQALGASKYTLFDRRNDTIRDARARQSAITSVIK